MYRILFFETSAFTGATRVTRTVAKRMAKRFETKTVVINNEQYPTEEIRKAIELEQPNILFSSFSTLNPDVIEEGKARNLIVVVRQDYKLKDLSAATFDRIKETYPKADWIIAQTPEMRHNLLALDPLKNAKIKVIDNPIDEEDILQKASAPNPFPENGCFHFLWVGRIDPIKDLPTLQRAFEIVHEQYPNTDLTLITGDPNPYRWIKNANCLVISSRSEASPNVLREALFLGTKVVSTDCSPTVRKLLPAEQIAKVGDQKSLAKCMSRVINVN